MTDVHTKKIRSYNMAMIKGKNTKPEILVRKYLFSRGFRYRVNVSELPGKPDIVFRKYKTVIFINGCFWHGHEGCSYFVVPKTRTEWWTNKIQKNKERDLKEYEQLQQMGWRVLVVWECLLKPKKRNETLQALELTISQQILNTYKKKMLSEYECPDYEDRQKVAEENLAGYDKGNLTR